MDAFHYSGLEGRQKPEMIGFAWAEILIELEKTRNSVLSHARSQISNFSDLPLICQKVFALELLYLRIFAVDYALYQICGDSSGRNKIFDVIRQCLDIKLKKLRHLLGKDVFDKSCLKPIALWQYQETNAHYMFKMLFNNELNSRLQTYNTIAANPFTQQEDFYLALGRQYSQFVIIKAVKPGQLISDEQQAEAITLAVNEFLGISRWIGRDLDNVEID
ncbi:hypothetical protein SCACP_34550 [Sporomusa carbonis]|uniref:hypothetical protein n=1 Tax=Sporomusa carbonis TaxID=3076075 RepID=UPI003A6820D9